jgi:hypothetical protein
MDCLSRDAPRTPAPCNAAFSRKGRLVGADVTPMITETMRVVGELHSAAGEHAQRGPRSTRQDV